MSAVLEKNLEILLPVPFDQTFTYKIGEGLKALEPGAYVEVSFGNRFLIGVVWAAETKDSKDAGEGGESSSKESSYTLKPLLKVFDLPPLPESSRKFLSWVAHYYGVPRGAVLKMMLSEGSVFKEIKRRSKGEREGPLCQTKEVVLSQEQQTCVAFLEKRLEGFHPVLLEGATGSGKTEVYLEILKKVRAQGKQSLILLPEIALSTQWLERFEQRFGEHPVVWHSDLSPAQRRENWEKIVKGEASVVVGARSALFLPYQNLGFLVVDEEHEASYKQESGVFYQARDMAVVRASLENCLVVLASATPSLETLVNVEEGRYEKCELIQRFGGATLPEVVLVDRRQKENTSLPGATWISKPLFEAIQETLAQKNQALLFLNRRGYAPLLLCAKCGVRTACKQCDSWLVYHKKQAILQCHYCGYKKPMVNVCGGCGEKDSLIPCGPGVERIVEEVQSLFPEARVLTMTSDTLTSLKVAEDHICKIKNKDVDIIVGTQVMAKGHHFPFLTLVGIIDGDWGTGGNDLRLMERTYHLLHQVAGRSGRAQEKGRVLIQSHMGEHPLMQGLLEQNPQRFLQLEKESRRHFGFPPYGRLVAVILSGRKADDVARFAHKMGACIPTQKGMEVFGPVPSAMTKLKGHYRWRFLLKGPRGLKVHPFLQHWIKKSEIPRSIKLQIDVDPYSFY